MTISETINANDDEPLYDDLTLRDYFASQAIARCIDVAAQFVMERPDFEAGTVMLSQVVKSGVTMAFHVADAMLAERAK